MNEDDPQFTNTLPSGGVVAPGERVPSGGVPETQFKPLEPGELIGRYRIRERVGEGGMGVVYAAEDPELGRVVAIKLLRPVQGDEDHGQQRRMLREAQALARVSHRNLVMVFDVGSVRGRVWIAMEYVAGDTLEIWLERERRTWSEIIDVFAEAGRGLAAVHAAGLVHRDFKPGNVIVRQDGTVQVLDFGLAAQAGNADDQRPREGAAPDLDALAATLTTTGAFMGTPAYMAPEQFMMLATDGRADQFGLCVALYEALYGRRPFNGRDLAQLMAATLEGLPGTPSALPGVPLAVRELLGKGLSRRPEDRFADMNALVEALVRTRGPLRASGQGGWRRFALGMLVGGAALAIGVGVWLARSQQEPAAVPAAAAVSSPDPVAPRIKPATAVPAPTEVPSGLALPSVNDEPEAPGLVVAPGEAAGAVVEATAVPATARVPAQVEVPGPALPEVLPSSALPSLTDLDEGDAPVVEPTKAPPGGEPPGGKPTEPDVAEVPTKPPAAATTIDGAGAEN